MQCLQKVKTFYVACFYAFKVKDDLINDLVLRIKVVEQKQNFSEEETEKENLDVEKRSECETSVSERKNNESASDIQDEKVFECDICTWKCKLSGFEPRSAPTALHGNLTP